MKTVRGTYRDNKIGRNSITFVADYDEGDTEFEVEIQDKWPALMNIELERGFKIRVGDRVVVQLFSGLGSFPRRILVNGVERFRSPYA